MRALKHFLLIILITLPFISCSRNLPTSPQEAYMMAGKSYKNNDPKTFLLICSQNTVLNYKRTAQIIKSMDNETQNSLKEKSFIPNKDTITAFDIIRDRFEKNNKSHDDPLLESLNRTILSSVIDGSSATLRIDNGVTIHLLREGMYWKIDESVSK